MASVTSSKPVKAATKGTKAVKKTVRQRKSAKAVASLSLPGERAVVLCTIHRGVFFGYAKSTKGRHIYLRQAKMAIYWGTSRGVVELAAVGPNSKSRASHPANMEVRDVSLVIEATPEAEAAWAKA